jgi:ribosomal protein S7
MVLRNLKSRNKIFPSDSFVFSSLFFARRIKNPMLFSNFFDITYVYQDLLHNFSNSNQDFNNKSALSVRKKLNLFFSVSLLNSYSSLFSLLHSYVAIHSQNFSFSNYSSRYYLVKNRTKLFIFNVHVKILPLLTRVLERRFFDHDVEYVYFSKSTYDLDCSFSSDLVKFDFIYPFFCNNINLVDFRTISSDSFFYEFSTNNSFNFIESAFLDENVSSSVYNYFSLFRTCKLLHFTDELSNSFFFDSLYDFSIRDYYLNSWIDWLHLNLNNSKVIRPFSFVDIFFRSSFFNKIISYMIRKGYKEKAENIFFNLVRFIKSTTFLNPFYFLFVCFNNFRFIFDLRKVRAFGKIQTIPQAVTPKKAFFFSWKNLVSYLKKRKTKLSFASRLYSILLCCFRKEGVLYDNYRNYVESCKSNQYLMNYFVK